MTTSSIFSFLHELKHNNNRTWFLEHKLKFEKAKKELEAIAQNIHHNIEAIDQVGPYKVYRIYKDVRFSKDKLPYKDHFGISIGRLQPYHRGGFYIHIEPNNCYIAGGFWNPEPKDLLRIRQAFQYEAEISKILDAPDLVNNFGTMQGEAVKTTPKGFDKNLERIDLIRKKQFILVRKFTDEEFLAPNFDKKVTAAYQLLLPFYHYMTEVLITDTNGEYII